MRRPLIKPFFTFYLAASLALAAGGAARAENAEVMLTVPVFHNNPIMAIVDGQPVRLDDLKNAKMQEAIEQLYQMQKSQLKQRIAQNLLLAHPELKAEPIPKVTADDINLFYKTTPGVKDLGSLQDKNIQAEIQRYLEKSFEEIHLEKIYKKAVEKGWVIDFLASPNDFRLVARVATGMLWAKADKDKHERRVMLLEFSDFQCPFCKRVQETLGKLRARYGGTVHFAYRHFPLPFHKEAQGLAEAVECARDQGRFWELQSKFYSVPANRVADEDVLKYAQAAGIPSMKDFKSCWKEGKYRERVRNDLDEGAQLGIQGTPSFIVGSYDAKTQTVSGEMFSGAATEEKFVSVIEKYLSQAGP